jgi:ribosomal protein S1
MSKLKEGVNIGNLPDPFPFLNNEHQILKVKGDEVNLSEDYQKLYKVMEKTFLEMREVREGEIINGVIVSNDDTEIVVDFGYKDHIYVDTPSGNLAKGLEVGTQIDVLVTNIQDTPFLIEGSITELIKMNVHNKLKTYYDEKLALTAKVKELIPAGYMLDIYMDNVTIDAFMPNTLADVNRLSKPESIIGETINVMLETLQQEKGVYVVSRRKYLKTLIPEEIKKLKKDEIYVGEVTGTTPFGVFIQFNGCLTGMIHKMNVVEEWQAKWDKIYPGQGIDFYVKEVAKNNKIILTQSLKESLWDSIKVGKILDGKVIDVKNFGALISLDYETMGLIQTTYLVKNEAKLTKGDSVKVKVISVIKGDRKIYLNLVK